MFTAYEMMKLVADAGLRQQQKRPGDFVDQNGLLVCGSCGKHRQRYVEAPHPVSSDPKDAIQILTVTPCKCDEAEDRAESEKKNASRSMERIRALKSASLMDKKFVNATFENARLNKYNSKNYKLCRRYATGFGEMIAKNQGLLLWGDFGTGKSYAAACIANYLLSRKIPVIMTSFVRVIEILSGSDTIAKGDLQHGLDTAQLVIFDDLGAERDTTYAIERVYSIVDRRYRKELPVIFTTNVTLEQMKTETDPAYGRIYDRIFETCHPMQFTGPSWRRMEANRRYDRMGDFLNSDTKEAK